jgi:hypothetical protein
MTTARTIACAVALLLSGCATTPDSVHQLAEVTASNVGVLGARLKQLADESDRIYKKRAENVARLRALNAQSRARYDYDIALTRKSMAVDDLALKKEIEDWKEQVDQILQSAAGAEQERRNALNAKEVKIETRATELLKIAESLSTLAKEENRSDRARMLALFAKEVRDDIKKDLDSGGESADAAKMLIDKVRGEFKPN